MKKADIEVGETYLAAQGRDYLYSKKRVKVIENEEYYTISERDVARSIRLADGLYRRAHLKWALTEAYPNDTTPRERDEAKHALRVAERQAADRWLNADPMRRFRKGSAGSRSTWDPSGILVYLIADNGEYVTTLVPRREIRMTWVEYEAKVEREQKARVEQEVRAAAAQRERDAKRPLVVAALEAIGIKAYLPSYQDKVTLTFDQVLALANTTDGEAGA
jgi:hypothetical protein